MRPAPDDGCKRADETEAIDTTVMMVNRMDQNQSQVAHSSQPQRGFGVEAALAHEIVRELAPAAERAGYRTFWVNDEADGDGLAALGAAAAVTTTIRLGVGAIPLDRQGPERIASRVKELALPVERLALGVGSGHPAGGLERVRNGVAALRDSIDATLVVAAIGPRMLALAGEIADGVLLDWPAPNYVVDATEIVARGAAEISRPRPWIGGYVFTAIGSPGIASCAEKLEHYAAIPSYAAHFARMGVGPMETVAYGEDAAALERGLEPYDAVLDETVVALSSPRRGHRLAISSFTPPRRVPEQGRPCSNRTSWIRTVGANACKTRANVETSLGMIDCLTAPGAKASCFPGPASLGECRSAPGDRRHPLGKADPQRYRQAAGVCRIHLPRRAQSRRRPAGRPDGAWWTRQGRLRLPLPNTSHYGTASSEPLSSQGHLARI